MPSYIISSQLFRRIIPTFKMKFYILFQIALYGVAGAVDCTVSGADLCLDNEWLLSVSILSIPDINSSNAD